MKGRGASVDTVATEFVIVVGIAPYVSAWMSPRGKNQASCKRWTLNPDDAFVYKGWEKASAAIDRMVKRGDVAEGQAKYCTFGEFVELLKA